MSSVHGSMVAKQAAFQWIRRNSRAATRWRSLRESDSSEQIASMSRTAACWAADSLIGQLLLACSAWADQTTLAGTKIPEFGGRRRRGGLCSVLPVRPEDGRTSSGAYHRGRPHRTRNTARRKGEQLYADYRRGARAAADAPAPGGFPAVTGAVRRGQARRV